MDRHVTEFHSKFWTLLKEFQTDEVLTDITVEVEGQNFKCHKLVLGTSSAFFRTMFSSNFEDAKSPLVPLSGVQASTFKIYIDFVYGHEYHLNEDNIHALLQAADHLQIDSLRAACIQFLRDNCSTNNCLKMLELSDTYHLDDLKEAAMDIMNTKFDEVSKTKDFLELSESAVKTIIESEDLKLTNEDPVFLAIQGWADHQARKRKKAFFQLLKHVRLPFCSATFLEHVVTTSTWMHDKEAAKYLEEARSYLYHPGKQHAKSSVRFQPRKHFNIKQILVTIPEEHTEISCWDDGVWLPITDITPKFKNRSYSTCCTQFAIVLTGGHLPGDTFSVSSDCMLFDFTDNKWRKFAGMYHARVFHAAVTDGQDIYAVGGKGRSKVLHCVEKFSPVVGEWSECKPMPVSIKYPLAAILGRFLYVTGGFVEGKENKTLFAHDTILQSWTENAEMPDGGIGADIATLDDKIYVLGGEKPRCMVYDTSNDFWITCAPPPVPRPFSTAIAWKGVLLLAGCVTADHADDVPRYTDKFEDGKWSDAKLKLPSDFGQKLHTMDLPRNIVDRIHRKRKYY